MKWECFSNSSLLDKSRKSINGTFGANSKFCDEYDLMKKYEIILFQLIEEFHSSTKQDKEWVEEIYKKCKSKYGFTMKDIGYIRLHLRLYFQEKLKFNQSKRQFLASQQISFFEIKKIHKKCSTHFHSMKKHFQYIEDYIEKKELDNEIIQLSNSIKHKL
jgi:hypothetical protein